MIDNTEIEANIISETIEVLKKRGRSSLLDPIREMLSFLFQIGSSQFHTIEHTLSTHGLMIKEEVFEFEERYNFFSPPSKADIILSLETQLNILKLGPNYAVISNSNSNSNSLPKPTSYHATTKSDRIDAINIQVCGISIQLYDVNSYLLRVFQNKAWQPFYGNASTIRSKIESLSDYEKAELLCNHNGEYVLINFWSNNSFHCKDYVEVNMYGTYVFIFQDRNYKLCVYYKDRLERLEEFTGNGRFIADKAKSLGVHERAEIFDAEGSILFKWRYKPPTTIEDCVVTGDENWNSFVKEAVSKKDE